MWGDVQKQVHMIGTDMSRDDQDVLAAADLPDQISQPLTNVAAEDRLAVLRDENEMVVESMNCVR